MEFSLLSREQVSVGNCLAPSWKKSKKRVGHNGGGWSQEGSADHLGDWWENEACPAPWDCYGSVTSHPGSSAASLVWIMSSEQAGVQWAVYLTCSSKFPIWSLQTLVHYVHCPRVPGVGVVGSHLTCLQPKPCAPRADRALLFR